MVLLIEECARLLNCNVKSLRDHINHPSNQRILQNAITGRKVRTIYEDRNGFNKTVIIGGITSKGADSIQAYGRLSRPFNICVAAHFYARRRIKLHHPFLPCVIEKFPRGGENRYYPLEMLELIDEDEMSTNRPFYSSNSNKKCFGNLFTTIETSLPTQKLPKINLNDEENDDDDEKEDEQTNWRSCCSQNVW